jgi:hypothetical protein
MLIKTDIALFCSIAFAIIVVWVGQICGFGGLIRFILEASAVPSAENKRKIVGWIACGNAY